ncbi:MAG: hypothetical protein HC881_13505 [Leptolyngbyaceae cyanobacterium SL_7_1]|nr:hypothetical protein [Leptolyngbyaceae cyanobacterium SL_7_1]
MINVGFFNLVSLLALLDGALAVFFLVTAIAPFVRGRSLKDAAALLLLIQAIAIPLSLLLAGGILFFQGMAT